MTTKRPRPKTTRPPITTTTIKVRKGLTRPLPNDEVFVDDSQGNNLIILIDLSNFYSLHFYSFPLLTFIKFVSFSEEEFEDNFVTNDRVPPAEKSLFFIERSTAEPEVDFEGRPWNPTDTEGSADEGIFGFEPQKIEDD